MMQVKTNLGIYNKTNPFMINNSKSSLYILEKLTFYPKNKPVKTGEISCLINRHGMIFFSVSKT